MLTAAPPQLELSAINHDHMAATFSPSEPGLVATPDASGPAMPQASTHVAEDTQGTLGGEQGGEGDADV
jgi:hypothetical protein